jgi:F0F1-type ATP synthase assembly protein I
LEDLLLEELRLRYDSEWDRKGTLDGKANNIVGTAGTVTGLVFGFVTFSTYIFEFSFPYYLGIIIVGSIIASIFVILVSIVAIRLQEYLSTFDIEDFTEVENKEKLKKAKDAEIRNPLSESYILCIKNNFNRNNDKAKKKGIATASLFISILLIGIAIGIILSLYQNKNSPTFAIQKKRKLKESNLMSPIQ